MVQDVPKTAPSRMPSRMPSPVLAVVFDLDGTLLSTEALIINVARTVLDLHGTQLTEEALKASIGKPPIEAWQSTMDVLGLTSEQTTAAELYRRSEDILEDLWHEATYLPGAVGLEELQGTSVVVAEDSASFTDQLETWLKNPDKHRLASRKAADFAEQSLAPRAVFESLGKLLCDLG